MNIKIYEDQTGLMIYPEVRSEKDGKIVSFFNNNVDLYIEKIGNTLTIYCHFIAYKKSARPLGYYVIYKDNYNDNELSNIKNHIYELLKEIDLQLRYGHAENIILENFEKLGLKGSNKWSGNTTDQIINALNGFETLDYKGGNIEEILIFYKEILKKADNVKLTISSVENTLGNINILINKKIQEPLVPSDRTREILDRYRQRIIENKNRKDAEIGKNKIKEGFTIMKDGIEIIKGTGVDPTDICIDEFSNVIDINRIKSRNEIVRDIDPEKKGIGTGLLVVVSILMLLIGVFVGAMVLPNTFLSKYIPTPIVTSTPIVTVKTPIATPTVIPVTAITVIPTANIAITATENITNNTNETMKKTKETSVLIPTNVTAHT